MIDHLNRSPRLLHHGLDMERERDYNADEFTRREITGKTPRPVTPITESQGIG